MAFISSMTESTYELIHLVGSKDATLLMQVECIENLDREEETTMMAISANGWNVYHVN